MARHGIARPPDCLSKRDDQRKLRIRWRVRKSRDDVAPVAARPRARGGSPTAAIVQAAVGETTELLACHRSMGRVTPRVPARLRANRGAAWPRPLISQLVWPLDDFPDPLVEARTTRTPQQWQLDEPGTIPARRAARSCCWLGGRSCPLRPYLRSTGGSAALAVVSQSAMFSKRMQSPGEQQPPVLLLHRPNGTPLASTQSALVSHGTPHP